jgi:glycosyltransferase involved in cell wall biosynthesis
MDNPFLSIITINFNNVEGLKKTIASVISQKFTKLEYIVIDGASTDGSAEYLETLNVPLLNWTSETDTGIYNAMNKGIEKSNGEYLLFLNSGDVLNGPKALEAFISHEEFSGDVIYGDYKFGDGYKRYPDTLYPAYFIKTSLPHQSTFFKRRVFEEMGGYDESYRMGADRAFYIKCYLSGKYTFKHVPYFLTLFDLSGLSNDPEEKILKNQEDSRMMKELYGDDFEKYKRQVEEELERNKVSKYSWKGILKRIKKRLNNL